MNMKLIFSSICLIAGLIAFLILNPIVKIGSGERGVILHWGAYQEEILGEGIHWVTPVSNTVKEMDVMVHKEEKESTASSKDLQEVTTKIALNYRLMPDKVNRLYQNYKYDYVDRVINPAIDEFVKKTTAQYTAEELITKREKVKDSLKDSLTKSLSESDIQVIDVYITDFKFSPSFNAAIEAKVTAEQSALESKNKLEQIKYEAEGLVASAKAEAESIRIQAQAVNQTGGKDYVALKAVEKWNGVLPTQMIPGGTLPFIRLDK